MAEENVNVNLSDLTAGLDELLATLDLGDVTAEASGGFEDLPEGYYLCCVENAELTVSKSSGKLMTKFTFKVMEDGIGSSVNDRGYVVNVPIEHTKNRKIFKYYGMSDASAVKRFVSDMLKFEAKDGSGDPLVPKECFTTSEVLSEALSCLVGEYIYVQLTVSTKGDKTSTWQNLISWKRAADLELPLE